MTDKKSHQDYADWELTGRRFYGTNPDWDWDKEESEEVISVNGVKTSCSDCGKIKPVLKMTCDTPNMHNSAEGVCLECDRNYALDLSVKYNHKYTLVDEDGKEAKA